MIKALDPDTDARRSDLLKRVYPFVTGLEVTAPTELDAKLDLASVLFACGLGVASEAIGPAGVVEHLEQLLAKWRERAAAGPFSGGRAIN